MSAQRATRRVGKRPPYFTTYTEIEVDIAPEELERAGWVFVGEDGGPTSERVIDVVHRWHDDNHEGPWTWCQHEPCDTLRGRNPG